MVLGYGAAWVYVQGRVYRPVYVDLCVFLVWRVYWAGLTGTFGWVYWSVRVYWAGLTELVVLIKCTGLHAGNWADWDSGPGSLDA
jgi:hypothetical protein